MLDLAEARRRRNRWRYLSAAAAVVAVAGGLFGGLQIGHLHDPHCARRPAGAADLGDGAGLELRLTGARATVAYSKELWGNAFQVLVDNIPLGTTCELWVVHPDGTRTEVAAWTTARDEGKVWYAGSMPSTAGRSAVPDHGGRPGAGDRHAHLTPGQHRRFPAGMDDGASALSMGVTGGLIALAAVLAVATFVGLVLRRRAGRFRTASPGRPRPGQQRPGRRR